MIFRIKDRCFAYGAPLCYLTIAAYGLPDALCPSISASGLICLGALIALIRVASDSPGDLFTVGKVKDAVFAQFWLRMGPFMVFMLGPMFAEGDKATAIPALVSEASGVVLELGPGIGSQLPRYYTSKITKVYGVEPNHDLRRSLREKVRASGLTDVHEIVPCGIEDVTELKKHGIALGSIDAVLSVQVLCSVPDPDDMLRLLYALMKPRGQLIVYEHVRSKDVVSVTVQNIYNIFWPFYCGNCHLNYDTQHSIMQAGDWEKIELTVPTSEDAWTLLPRIYGRLWKKQ